MKIFLGGLALVCSLPAMATPLTLFSDLGPVGNVYSTVEGWSVAGSASTEGQSFMNADLITVGGIGSFAVTQIDIADTDFQGSSPATFQASIWTDNAGVPGTQVAGASWDPLTTTTAFGACCGLVSITNITGVTLTGGQQYFVILAPVLNSNTSYTVWDWNNQGVTGLDLYSNNGGVTWNSEGTGNPVGAFDILGSVVPEPMTFSLLGAGLLGLGLLRSRMKK